MKKYAVIVAGGSGTRMGGGIPKQFRSLCGKPMLWWSMKAFHDEDPGTKLILVIPKDFESIWNDFIGSLPDAERFPHLIAYGGVSRTESVRNGLEKVGDLESLVAVHDGARPLIDVATIGSGWLEAEKYEGAVPVVAVTDSLREIDGHSSRPVDRSRYMAVQTPQIFKSKSLKAAYDIVGNKSFTDDAALMENAGFKVTTFQGCHNNIKVTNPIDMVIATAILDKNA